MNKEELLKMALEADFEYCASAESEWMECYIDDLVSFANAIIERAALELEQYGSIQDTSGMEMAKEIRALKTENSV